MELLLLRHSITPGNLKRQYIGSTDQPLAPEGEALARKRRGEMPEIGGLWVSPMLRCRQTAALLFPGVEQRAGSRSCGSAPSDGLKKRPGRS